MSNKQTIIGEINDLFRSPTALLYKEEVYKVCTWGACKSYLTWPEGAPEGWDELEEKTEFFIGRCGTRYVTFAVDSDCRQHDNDVYTKLYAATESCIEECADNICYELDLEEDEYHIWECHD